MATGLVATRPRRGSPEATRTYRLELQHLIYDDFFRWLLDRLPVGQSATTRTAARRDDVQRETAGVKATHTTAETRPRGLTPPRHRGPVVGVSLQPGQDRPVHPMHSRNGGGSIEVASAAPTEPPKRPRK